MLKHHYRLSKGVRLLDAGRILKRFGMILASIMKKINNVTWTPRQKGLEENEAPTRRHAKSGGGHIASTSTTLPSPEIVKNASSSYA